MKITFFSNYLNHHQLPFCKEMVKRLDSNFKFVATEKTPNDRIELGYEDMNDKYNFVVKAYQNEYEAFKLGIESDVVIIGSAPDKYIKERIRQKKITFRYSEHIFKKGFNVKLFLSIFVKRTLLERNNTYLLCASAYANNDYSIAGAYINKCYKWGYFPELKEYESINKLLERKQYKKILWVARFIDWKHPEIAIEIAKKLRDEKYDFEINMIGIGELENKIRIMIEGNNLVDCVKLLGAMSPDKVRKHMEESRIFIFTSDRGEGWGAVLNEAMNSGCAVVASHAIGSVPFLIKDKENGLIYEDGNLDDLFNKVKLLLGNPDMCNDIGSNAYDTMIKTWNPRIATRRILELSKYLMSHKTCNLFEEGPCSKAERIKDNWYINLNRKKG